MEFVLILQAIFNGVAAFLGLPVPGLSLGEDRLVSFGDLFLAFMLASLGVALLRYVFGFGGGGGDSPRTSSTNDPKISKVRKGDEY